MFKVMGMNIVVIYVFWNYYEVVSGVWDFKIENRDLVEFLCIVKSEGLYVIFRSGLYVCGEWEFGGYFWWL